VENSGYDISPFNSYSRSDIVLSKPLKQVGVSLYQYFTEDDTELYKGNVYVNGTSEVIITYSGMAVNVVANVAGGTLDAAEYYTNACKLTITASGEVEVTINGTKLTEAKSEVIIPSGEKGETVTVENPLITNPERANAVGEWVERYLRRRMTLSSSWRADPRLDALDVVENPNEYNINSVRMTEVKFTYNGAFRGTGEGRVI
jgi:hypothetical protein